MLGVGERKRRRYGVTQSTEYTRVHSKNVSKHNEKTVVVGCYGVSFDRRKDTGSSGRK